MKKVFLFLFISINTVQLYSQKIDDNFVTGKWVVLKAIAHKEANKPETKSILEGFKNATYIFNENHSFEFSTTSKSEEVVSIIEMLQKTKWIISKKGNIIQIGNKKDNYTIFGFIVKIINDSIVFTIPEAEIELTMKKT